ncbi:hypothetical protein [Paracidovorax cattleyae]|uniref:hypothetical protein n=1 Tax=Paracidovorax cattleyae TaxID=80868 RepID=UPI001ABF8F5A|nr:hypothetical protein [Paracidovorax cattleyae]
MQNKIDEQTFFESNNGEVNFWIEQESSIHLKAVTRDSDPVEISAEEAMEIAEKLKAFALQILTNENQQIPAVRHIQG